MKNPGDVVSGLKHDNRLKCHRGIVSQWTYQVGLNVTVDERWVDVTSRHPLPAPLLPHPSHSIWPMSRTASCVCTVNIPHRVIMYYVETKAICCQTRFGQFLSSH
jgi:hypothetical protein